MKLQYLLMVTYPDARPDGGGRLTRYSEPEGIEVALLGIRDKGHWVSNDSVGVMTCVEIWNICNRYRLKE